VGHRRRVGDEWFVVRGVARSPARHGANSYRTIVDDIE
jgi:hypothetical protein